MLIIILLCFTFSIVCAAIRAFWYPPPPPPNRPHLGWLAIVFLVLAFMIEYAFKR